MKKSENLFMENDVEDITPMEDETSLNSITENGDNVGDSDELKPDPVELLKTLHYGRQSRPKNIHNKAFKIKRKKRIKEQKKSRKNNRKK